MGSHRPQKRRQVFRESHVLQRPNLGNTVNPAHPWPSQPRLKFCLTEVQIVEDFSYTCSLLHGEKTEKRDRFEESSIIFPAKMYFVARPSFAPDRKTSASCGSRGQLPREAKLCKLCLGSSGRSSSTQHNVDLLTRVCHHASHNVLGHARQSLQPVAGNSDFCDAHHMRCLMRSRRSCIVQ